MFLTDSLLKPILFRVLTRFYSGWGHFLEEGLAPKVFTLARLAFILCPSATPHLPNDHGSNPGEKTEKGLAQLVDFWVLRYIFFVKVHKEEVGQKGVEWRVADIPQFSVLLIDFSRLIVRFFSFIGQSHQLGRSFMLLFVFGGNWGRLRLQSEAASLLYCFRG